VRALLLEHWLPAQESRGLRATTLNQYQTIAESWIVPRLGGVRASSLTPAMVQTLTTALREEKSSKGRKGLSARSAAHAVGVLKAACAFAVETGLLGRNPLAGVRRPRSETRPMTAWSVTDARAFLKATEGDRLAAGWALLLTRGLRRGELAGLKWEAINLEGRAMQMQIVSTRVVVDGKAVTSAPKTSAGRRSIPLDDSLLGLLRAHRARQAKERLAAGEAYEDGGYVFCNALGHPYNPKYISARFEALVKAAGLARIRLHDTRHTAASLMLAAGVPTKVVSEMLGHSSPGITLMTYAHVMPGMAEEAGAALSASLLH